MHLETVIAMALNEELDPKQITANIRSRRSVYPKDYSGKVVERWIIDEMLENANWAPNHKLTEPWRFQVFTGSGLKRFADFQAERYKLLAQSNGDFLDAKYQKLLSKPLLCSHIISIGMVRDPGEKVPEIEEIEAVSCAVMNMWLTASAYGVGCYWSSGGVTYDPEAKSFFGLSEKDKLLGFMYVGIPSNHPSARTPTPLNGKVEWIED